MENPKVKMTETQNSYIVSMGETESHFAKTNPLAHWMAHQKFEEYKHRADQIADFVTDALGGRDSMLVSIEDLARLSLVGGEVGNYVSGIIHARVTLRAAGVEIAG